jgi:Signal transduction histidine kinase
MAGVGIAQKKAECRKEFILATAASAWWVFCQAFELMATELPVKIFWANIEYLGYINAFAYFLLVCRFTGYDKWINKKSIAIMLSIYAAFFILIFTDRWHGLMRKNFSLDTSAIPYTIKKDYGILYPLYYVYAGGVNLLSFGLLLVSIFKRNTIYKKQAFIFLGALLPIFVFNVLYILGASPVPRHDITPAFFGLAGVIYAYGLMRHSLINITPIARDMLLETMRDGVIVTDKGGLISDMNRAMSEILQLDFQKCKEKRVGDIASLKDILRSTTDGGFEDGAVNIGEKIFDVKHFPVTDTRGGDIGMMYIFYDITELRTNTETIIRQQKAISVIAERERFGRDLHDNLGQMFGYIIVQGQSVKERFSGGDTDTAEKQLDQLIAAARKAHTDTREYILKMRGIPSRNRNFSVTLKSYCTEFTEKYGIPVSVVFSEKLPEGFPEDETGVQLLRIIQEALNNAGKHAGHCKVNISFLQTEEGVEMNIEDDGRGFDTAALMGADGHGLSIMDERSREIGASFRISSGMGEGTKITVKF